MNDFVRLLDHVPGIMLVIARLGGLVFFAPFLNGTVIPPRVKVALSIVIGLAVYPTVDSVHAVAPLEFDLFTLAPLLALEIGVGVIIGYLASIPMITVQIGGLLAGQQMGMGFARLYNPATDLSANLISQALFFMLLGGVLAMNGLDDMFAAVLHTYSCIPVGGVRVDGELIDLILGLLLSGCEVALRVALPVLAVVYLQSVAMGYLTKTTPQLNILSLGFPLRIMVGLATLAVSLGAIEAISLDEWDRARDTIMTWIDSHG